MNRKQKLVLMVGICLITLMGLYPPWVRTFLVGQQRMRAESPVGYASIFEPPEVRDHRVVGIHIDFSRLLIQWAAVATLFGGLFWALKTSKFQVQPPPPPDDRSRKRAWYYSKDGKQKGPFAQSKLIAMISAGELPSDALVWKESMPEWKLASEVEALQSPSPYSHQPTEPSSGQKTELIERRDSVAADIEPSAHQESISLPLQEQQTKPSKTNAGYAVFRGVLSEFGVGRSPQSKSESPPPEQPLHFLPCPPFEEEAALATREGIDTRKEKAGIWRRVQAWQFGEFATWAGDLVSGGWWLSGGRFSLWKMYKLVGVMFLCVIVGAVVFQVLGETIGGIIFLLVAIGVGALAVIWFVRSWVEYIRDIANRKGSKKDS